MEDLKKCKVFISSPSDLQDERKLIAEYVKNMKRQGIIFEPLRFEVNLPVTSSVRPQSLINEELLDKADILIGIFGTRFGTKTEKADSGTVEEIETFIAKKRPVILYFYNIVLNTTQLTSKDLEELKKINEFKEKYKDDHIYANIDDFQQLGDALDRDIDYNLNKIMAMETVESNKNKKITGTKQQRGKRTVQRKYTKDNKKSWYEDSIAELINDHLRKKGIPFHYRDNLTFHENLNFFRGTTNFIISSEENILDQARISAFNQKYGNYDYCEDLRDRFPNWSRKILNKIQEFKPDLHGATVLNVGGNDGSELQQIFAEYPELDFTVVDISDVAIKKGESESVLKNIHFLQANMEAAYLNGSAFDICLCLRAIQSRGVFTHDAIIQMCKHLKQDGILIISIPNGYKHDDSVERGLYDHRSRMFLKTKPQDVAHKVERKMIDYGFTITGIETIDTEIIIWGLERK